MDENTQFIICYLYYILHCMTIHMCMEFYVMNKLIYISHYLSGHNPVRMGGGESPHFSCDFWGLVKL